VVELSNNVIEHAYGGRDDGPMWVKLRFDGDGIELEVADCGRPLNPARLEGAETPEVDAERPDALPEGGFGLALVRQLSDRIECRAEHGWNIVRVERALTPSPEEPS
jgi:serine/threonine-protein kinase RsbW